MQELFRKLSNVFNFFREDRMPEEGGPNEGGNVAPATPDSPDLRPTETMNFGPDVIKGEIKATEAQGKGEIRATVMGLRGFELPGKKPTKAPSVLDQFKDFKVDLGGAQSGKLADSVKNIGASRPEQANIPATRGEITNPTVGQSRGIAEIETTKADASSERQKEALSAKVQELAKVLNVKILKIELDSNGQPKNVILSAFDEEGLALATQVANEELGGALNPIYKEPNGPKRLNQIISTIVALWTLGLKNEASALINETTSSADYIRNSEAKYNKLSKGEIAQAKSDAFLKLDATLASYTPSALASANKQRK